MKSHAQLRIKSAKSKSKKRSRADQLLIPVKTGEDDNSDGSADDKFMCDSGGNENVDHFRIPVVKVEKDGHGQQQSVATCAPDTTGPFVSM